MGTGRLTASHATFFKVCECLRTNREQLSQFRNIKELRSFVSDTINNPVSVNCIENALEVTEIDFESARKKSRGLRTTTNRKVLIASVIELFQQYGSPVPLELMAAYKDAAGSDYSSGLKLLTFPQPVNSVPDPKNISVAPKK